MLGVQVLVAAAPKEETTEGGIILSKDVKTTASEPGVVIAVGPEVTSVLPKDVVYLQWNESMPVRVKGQEAVIVEEKHIKAVLS
jgi:co-chaperonin GroES (HSP10)